MKYTQNRYRHYVNCTASSNISRLPDIVHPHSPLLPIPWDPNTKLSDKKYWHDLKCFCLHWWGKKIFSRTSLLKLEEAAWWEIQLHGLLIPKSSCVFQPYLSFLSKLASPSCQTICFPLHQEAESHCSYYIKCFSRLWGAKLLERIWPPYWVS